MKERGILFSAPMVRALLAGRKTQTRRAVKFPEWFEFEYPRESGRPAAAAMELDCPYGNRGDRLWVRETWAAHWMYDDVPPRDARTNPTLPGDNYWFRADGEGAPGSAGCPADGRRGRWRPGIHMPRWASRLTLEIEWVRVERVQNIDPLDAEAEGVMSLTEAEVAALNRPGKTWTRGPALARWELLWESINGAESWLANPVVWAISFRVVQERRNEPGA